MRRRRSGKSGGSAHWPDQFVNSADKARQDKMASLVERMLELHNRTPKTPQAQELVKREIKSTDRAIDRLVYELTKVLV